MEKGKCTDIDDALSRKANRVYFVPTIVYTALVNKI